MRLAVLPTIPSVVLPAAVSVEAPPAVAVVAAPAVAVVASVVDSVSPFPSYAATVARTPRCRSVLAVTVRSTAATVLAACVTDFIAGWLLQSGSSVARGSGLSGG